MRRITTAISAAALSLSMALSLNTGVVQATTPGYDSAYQFESAFLSLKPSDSGTFSVFFANTGTTSWVAGTGTQVNLAICAADKVTCNVTSAQAAWANGWLSSTAYATATKSAVAPGDFSAFTYNVKVPTGTATGTYRFNGDLVVGATGDRIHPEGYYQDGTVTGGAAGGGALSVTPAYASNEDNEVSNPVPGIGQHTYTFTTTLTGTLSFAVMRSGNISRISDGSYGFCDTNQDSKADNLSDEQAFITAVNGTSISATNPLINQAIPSNGTITITVDSAIRQERVRVIAWQDLNNNGQIDLITQGDSQCDFPNQATNNTTVDGAMIVSGRKYWFGPAAQFGAVAGVGGGIGPACGAREPNGFVYGGATYNGAVAGAVPMFRGDTANQVFGAGLKSGNTATAGSVSLQGSNALRYYYDSNDIFQVLGTQTTLATWKAELDTSTSGSADQVAIAYDPNPAGISTFNLCVRKGWDAPVDLTAAVGDLDAGGAVDDVRLTYTTPATNIATTFNVQRSANSTSNPVTSANCNANMSPNPNGATWAASDVSNGAAAVGNNAPNDGTASTLPNSAFTTVGSTSTNGVSEQGSFTNFDLTVGDYCYRLQATDPNLGINSYSNYFFIHVPGGAPSSASVLSSTSATLTSTSGFANQLSSGDKFTIKFTDATCVACGVSIAANAVIRVTDSDCGQWPNPTGAGTPTQGTSGCTGGNTDTVADVVCGTNANCVSSTTTQTNDTLTVTMTGNPQTVAAGTVPGVQYNVLVTDSSGITDLSGNTWNLTASTDRTFGPVGQ